MGINTRNNPQGCTALRTKYIDNADITNNTKGKYSLFILTPIVTNFTGGTF